MRKKGAHTFISAFLSPALESTIPKLATCQYFTRDLSQVCFSFKWCDSQSFNSQTRRLALADLQLADSQLALYSDSKILQEYFALI